MKFSLKHYILLFAVGMMSVVACSDDDDDDPAPAAGGGTGGGGGGANTEERITAFANGDTVDFQTTTVTIDDFSRADDYVVILGVNNSPSERISIDFKRTFTGTATYPQATEEVITYTKNGTLFIPLSGTLVVNRNDSIVSGTFEFEGTPAVAGSDTLSVKNGEFYLKL